MRIGYLKLLANQMIKHPMVNLNWSNLMRKVQVGTTSDRHIAKHLYYYILLGVESI